MSHKQLILFSLIYCVYCHEVPIVTTTQGLVSGLKAEDGDYNMYLGIPYGVVDQSNPFGASSPHPHFQSIFNATDDSAKCPQSDNFNNGSLVGTLDCLHLSVFVPTTASSTNRLPVLVWIFGGKFEFSSYGRYIYGPKFLVRHDIIVVNVNYRLGPFGFMCTDHPAVPGNQGLKDQLMAIKWVKSNIENFGGDSSKITLDGNSSGSKSVDFQIIRNTDRLFNQAILQSGTSLSPSIAPFRDAPLIVSEHLGFQADDILSAIKYLSNLEPLRIIEASKKLGLTYSPCVERSFFGVESFLSEDWFKKYVIPTAKDMNIMVGFTKDESLSSIVSNFQNIAITVNDSLSLTFDIEHEEFTGISDVEHFFFGDEESDDKMIESAIELSSDISFIHPSVRAVERFLKSDAQKAYLYLFSYDGDRSLLKQIFNITRGGANHADELGYLFDIMAYMDEPNAEDQLIMDRMTTMWANFVKYGDPTPQTTALLPVKWKAITASSPRHYIEITTDMKAGTRPFNRRMAFWDLFFKINGHLQVFSLNAEADRRRMD